MARIKQVKQTHINFRRRLPDGRTEHISEPVVHRAPLRARTYSVGERVTIVELMIFNLVDRELVIERDINHLVHAKLKIQKCEDLLNLGLDAPRLGRAAPRLQVIDMWRKLVELKLLKGSRKTIATITPKGKRHIKKQPKRLRLCAQKLVFTDLLEKLGLAVV